MNCKEYSIMLGRALHKMTDSIIMIDNRPYNSCSPTHTTRLVIIFSNLSSRHMLCALPRSNTSSSLFPLHHIPFTWLTSCPFQTAEKSLPQEAISHIHNLMRCVSLLPVSDSCLSTRHTALQLSAHLLISLLAISSLSRGTMSNLSFYLQPLVSLQAHSRCSINRKSEKLQL